MLKIGIGHSEDIDSAEAIADILEQCATGLEGIQAQAGLVYASNDHEFELILNTINEAHPNIQLIGCTTDGEMSSTLGFTEDSLNLILFSSDEIEFTAGVADGVSRNLVASITQAVRDAKSQSTKENRLCIMNPSSLTVSGVQVVEEFRKNLGENFPIFGATAADQWEFNQTYQFCNTTVYTDAVPFLLFSGQIFFGSGVSSGWSAIGKRGIITRVENNVLFEINNQPALDFYKHYLGDEVEPIGEFPLAVYESGQESDFYLRSPLTINDDGSLVFAGDLAEGAEVQITHTTRDKIIEASEAAVSTSIHNYAGDRPDVAICFSCAGRKQVLGTRTQEEIQLLKKFNPDLKIFGFYGYGEIAPLERFTPTMFHNETFISLLLGSN